MTKKRSPNYPGLSLEDAITSVTRIYRSEHTHAAAQAAVIGDLGYSSASGRALAQLGAMRAYELLEGRGDAIRVSPKAVAIIEFIAEPTNQTRLQALRDCAFAPTIFKEMRDQYGDHLPSDAALRHWLIAKDYLSKAADEVIHTYRDNLEFLHRLNVSYNREDEDASPETEGMRIAIGDYVQWDSQGVLQFPQPKRVRELSEDGEWAFVEGSNTGMPVKELTLENPSATKPEASNPPRPRTMVEAQQAAGQVLPTSLGSRQDIFSLPEGPVTLQWPATLGQESFQDLSDWLDILKRKIGRSVSVNLVGAKYIPIKAQTNRVEPLPDSRKSELVPPTEPEPSPR